MIAYLGNRVDRLKRARDKRPRVVGVRRHKNKTGKCHHCGRKDLKVTVLVMLPDGTLKNFGKVCIQKMRVQPNHYKISGLHEKKAKHQIVHEIYESSTAKRGYPVVVHHFNGATRKEALGYLRAHMKTDEFLRDCTRKGKWDGVKCKSRAYWTNGGVVRLHR